MLSGRASEVCPAAAQEGVWAGLGPAASASLQAAQSRALGGGPALSSGTRHRALGLSSGAGPHPGWDWRLRLRARPMRAGGAASLVASTLFPPPPWVWTPRSPVAEPSGFPWTALGVSDRLTQPWAHPPLGSLLLHVPGRRRPPGSALVSLGVATRGSALRTALASGPEATAGREVPGVGRAHLGGASWGLCPSLGSAGLVCGWLYFRVNTAVPKKGRVPGGLPVLYASHFWSAGRALCSCPNPSQSEGPALGGLSQGQGTN